MRLRPSPPTRPARRAGLRLATLAGLLLAATPALACDGPVFANYRSQPPLLALQADTALQVTVHHDGCVAVRFPQQDVRAGTRHWQMPEARWKALRSEVVASGVAQLDAVALKRRIAAASEKHGKGELPAAGEPVLYATADENLLEFVLPTDHAGKQQRGLSWTSLHGDQLNLPDDPDLARIAALRDAFEDLAAETHSKGMPR